MKTEEELYNEQKELSQRRNEAAYAIVGWAIACVDSVDDHAKRQRLRELIDRYKAADVRLEDFYTEVPRP